LPLAAQLLYSLESAKHLLRCPIIFPYYNSELDFFAAEAVNKEKQSLQQLTVLLRRCLEILHLLKIVCDHQFHVVTKTLTSQQQIALKTNTLKSLLSSGSEEVSWHRDLDGFL